MAPHSQDQADTPSTFQEDYVILTDDSDTSPMRIYLKYLENPDLWNQIAEHNLLRPGVRIRIPGDMLKRDRIPSKVVHCAGTVEVSRAFDNGSQPGGQPELQAQREQWTPAVEALLVQEGDWIRTGVRSSVVIRQEDGTEVRLEPESKLLLQRARLSRNASGNVRLTRLELESGSISSNVVELENGSRFEVSTASATTSIHGTEFRLRVTSQGETRLEVLAGVAEFANAAESVTVDGNHGSVISDTTSRPRSPQHLPATPQRLVFTGDDVTRGFEPDVLSWEPVPNATRYELEIARDTGFSNLLARWSTKLTSSTMDTGVNITTGVYYVRVSAVDIHGFRGAPSQPQYLSYQQD